MKTKNRIWLCQFIVMGLVLILTNNCKKEKDKVENEITDKDGNVYTSVTIGTQVWMVENLKTTKYNDGTAIPNITDNTEWYNLTTGAYCWYDNDASTYKLFYGALYNWYAVNTSKLCPTGWHIPTKAEWTELTAYLGGESVAGGKMKEIGTIHWNNPNNGATNESGLAGLPGGFRYDVGIYSGISNDGIWWSATEDNIHTAWFQGLYFEDSNAYMGTNDKYLGFSVRCVKDDN
jgi:uncharacterized protein (TIGR02145 family)